MNSINKMIKKFTSNPDNDYILLTPLIIIMVISGAYLILELWQLIENYWSNS